MQSVSCFCVNLLEFQSSIQRDSTRLQQLFCTFAKPDHPYSKFVWGNTASLKDGPKRTGVHLYKRLREFYKLMYSSHFMTLAVQSSGWLVYSVGIYKCIGVHVANEKQCTLRAQVFVWFSIRF